MTNVRNYIAGLKGKAAPSKRRTYSKTKSSLGGVGKAGKKVAPKATGHKSGSKGVRKASRKAAATNRRRTQSPKKPVNVAGYIRSRQRK